ncbi:MAG: sulfite exporter TauE/SafE family protein [Gemmatimonadaceae bacterium]|nr:sulfite exporter TauE/SafE family protein [Gemmatimonadaceae bacterium]
MILTTSGILLASLVGSVHCAGMCGGFVCLYTNGTDDAGNALASSAFLGAHAMYNVGRLVSYLLLGAAAGALGSRVTQLGVLAGISRAAALVAGVLMVGWALSALAARRGVSLARVPTPVAWQRLIGGWLIPVRRMPPTSRALFTGVLTTLLPCGWLYVFVAAAGGTGSVSLAMLTMFVFWLGTVPALVAVGVGAQTVLMPFRTRLPALSAAVVLIMGLLTMTGHFAGMEVQHVH